MYDFLITVWISPLFAVLFASALCKALELKPPPLKKASLNAEEALPPSSKSNGVRKSVSKAFKNFFGLFVEILTALSNISPSTAGDKTSLLPNPANISEISAF